MSRAISWKNVQVVRPQPGQAVTCGGKRAQAERLEDLLGDLAPPRSRSPPGAGVSDTRIVSPIPRCSRIERPAVTATMPFVPMPASVRPEVQRVVAARRERR